MSWKSDWFKGGFDSDGTNPDIISGGLKLGGTIMLPSTRYTVDHYSGKGYPVVPPTASVVAKTATGNISSSNFEKNITNTGSSDTIVLTLPAAASYAGKTIRFQITAAHIVQIDVQTGEKIYLGGSGVAGKYAQIAGVIGNYADVYCDGTQYLITGYSGVVTKEA